MPFIVTLFLQQGNSIRSHSGGMWMTVSETACSFVNLFVQDNASVL